MKAGPADRDGRDRAGHRRDEGSYRRLLRRRHLLASTLAWLAEKRRVRVTSATFFAAQVDFTHAGDLLVFVDEDQISALERDMQTAGVLEGSKMAMAFNMLRSNDLIWSYVVSNYLKGKPPSSFDLLHWNSDATRMPAANHSYLPAQLLSGEPALHRHHGAGQHAARSVEGQGARLQSGDPRGSHRAGRFGAVRLAILRRPGEICAVRIGPYRRRGQPAGRQANTSTGPTTTSRTVKLADWLKGAQEHKGSWWPDWRNGSADLDAEREVPARAVGSETHAADRGRARQLRPGSRVA